MTTLTGKVLVYCDCSQSDECPQGKIASEWRCSVWMERRHVTPAKRDEVKNMHKRG